MVRISRTLLLLATCMFTSGTDAARTTRDVARVVNDGSQNASKRSDGAKKWTRETGFRRRRCGIELAKPEAEEDDLLREMMKIRVPEFVGKGADLCNRDPQRCSHCRDKESPCQQLVYKKAWKVNRLWPTNSWGTQITGDQVYAQTVKEMNAHHGGKEFAFTSWNSPPKVGLNEYLLWQGGAEAYAERKICDGPEVDGNGAFGVGNYFADAMDKSDQYVTNHYQTSDYHDGTKETPNWWLRELLKNANMSSLDASGQAVSSPVPPEDIPAEGSDTIFILLFRAYLGRYAKVQRDGYGCQDWYWEDPADGKRYTTKGCPDAQTWEAPFEHNSNVAVALGRNYDRHEDIGGKKPVFYNEYVVPDKKYLKVEYIVQYDRIDN